MASGSQPVSASLWVATQGFTFDRGRQPVFIHPGAVFLASNPVNRGHEAFFTPLVLVAEFEPGLPLTEVPVRVVGRADDDAFSWLQMKIAATVQSAETSLYNIGE